MEIPTPGEAFFSQDLIPHSDTVSRVCSSLVGERIEAPGNSVTVNSGPQGDGL